MDEQQVMAALRGVIDPLSGRDLVSAGMIQGLALKGGNVQVSIEIDPNRAPEMEPVREAAEQAVRALPGVTSVVAVLTAERKPPPPPTRGPGHGGPGHGGPGHGGHGQHQAKIDLPGVAAIVAVASGKGGVGKSTVTANLAVALAARGLRVGLLDADIYGPSQPRMLGIKGKPTATPDKKWLPMQGHGVVCMSVGFLMEEDTALIWRGPMVMGALQQMLRDVAWGPLDILLVDMPPGTGDAQLTMAQSVSLAGAIIVSTPQDIALIDARRGLNMFRKVEVPVFGIVENMSYFACPHCGERTDIFGHGGARDEASRLGTPFLGEIPLHLNVRETGDAGTPIVAAKPESAEAQAFRAIADRLVDSLGVVKMKPAPRIVIE
ncbi:MAG TPA: Mrp/NBP35 family ATP-binding protein [Stellaceae bacterium]|jgi:ATP-binding protein involved in chromosome partitioning|nr:Mrp/NBP35 family ATP-binding protein [Stellaceae bacterium]